ncbi:MAG: sigma-70 family RNA polymerase sigma factor [Bacteroidota bacterium]
MITITDTLNLKMSDEDIVDRIVKGEQHLYERLMRKYNERLYRISMSIVNDDKEAEDIMQTAYINAYRQLTAFQGKSSFGTWLTRILIYESLLHKKKKLKHQKVLMEKQHNDYHTDTPLKELVNKELKGILEKAVADLPEKYRLVFVMREVQEMSTTETMEALNIGESNVKIRLSRAKEMLRAGLNNYWQPKQVYEFNLVRCDVVISYVMGALNISAC